MIKKQSVTNVKQENITKTKFILIIQTFLNIFQAI